jgi:hypothetical protein
MKLIITELSSREGYLESWRPSQPSTVYRLRSQLARFINWLAGIDIHQLSGAERIVTRHLPRGITLAHASAGDLARATRAALESRSGQAEEIVTFVFSSLKSDETEKAEALVQSVVSAISTKSVPNFMRIAVRARPSLASTIAESAAMLLPDEAKEISTAVESVVTTDC